MKQKNYIIYIIFIIFFIILFLFSFSLLKKYFNYNSTTFDFYKLPYEKEPNNSFKNANILSLNSNIYGKIDHANDIDLFLIYNNDITKKVLNIYLTDINVKDIIIKLFDFNKKLILFSPFRKLLNIKIPPKTYYYIKIYSENGNYSNLTYNLIVTIQKKYNKFAELEPNNTFEKANVININSTINGQTKKFDKDYYTFKVNSSDFFLISLVINNSPLTLYLYSKNHLPIYTLENLNKSVIISPIFFTKGVYYIEITGNNSNYSLLVNKSNWTGEVEFNNTIETANEFSLTDEIKGSIGWLYDIDYFKISIKKEDNYTIEINKFSNSILYLNIFSNKNNIPIKKIILNDIQNIFEIHLNIGEYYFKFTTKNYNKPIKYNFRILK